MPLPRAVLLALALLPSSAIALEAPDPAAPGQTVLVGDAASAPLLALPDDVALALATRNHAAAAKGLAALPVSSLSGNTVGDRAFLLAWSLLRADRGAEAVPLLEEIRRAEHVPVAYRDLTVGEVLLEDGQHAAAAAVLETIPEVALIWPRARLRAAEAHRQSGATQRSREILLALAERPDPSEGSALALWALAEGAGFGSPESYAWLRRLWVSYPRSKEGIAAARQLAPYESKGARYRATDLEVATRAEALMDAWRFEDANKLLAENAGRFSTATEAACIAWYVDGRSHFKRNNITRAAEVLVPAGENCAGIDEDRGASALYVAGKALERKKDWVGAAKAYQRIPALYPAHSMADDGYALAGIAWQIADQPSKAIELWTEQVARYPDGDMAAEGFWRLAWNAYLSGDTDAAIDHAERGLWEVPVSADPVHVLACSYWAARWRIYPHVDDPTALGPDPEQVARGIDLLLKLCQDHPSSFYALLAAGRLYELAPDRLAAVQRPEVWPRSDTWTVRADFLSEPGVQTGLDLARLGLVEDALAELRRTAQDALTPSEFALITEIQARTDAIKAHDALHHFLLTHPPESLGADRDRIVETAFPDRYWDLVQAAADGYDYDPRVFHALVREESSFNPEIVSWAGARGLSQLMPATARQTAAWMGMKVTNDQLFDPETNLRIGSRYLQFLADRYDGNVFLAVPGYNAGPGNVDRWLGEAGDVPTDEYVERIPIRETRGYVKRVLGTYQLYRVHYDPGPVFPDWSRFNHHARPEEG